GDVDDLPAFIPEHAEIEIPALANPLDRHLEAGLAVEVAVADRLDILPDAARRNRVGLCGSPHRQRGADRGNLQRLHEPHSPPSRWAAGERPMLCGRPKSPLASWE